MTPIRDIIDIPERVHRDDFVLRVAQGVGRQAWTPPERRGRRKATG